MQSEGVNKNQSLKKALQILEVMSEFDFPVRLHDLSQRLSMSPSTVLRFLNTFIDYGYVMQDPETSFYQLTLKLASLGYKNRLNYPANKILTKYGTRAEKVAKIAQKKYIRTHKEEEK